MRIPARPKEFTTRLPEHLEVPDAPVFTFRFPTQKEEIGVSATGGRAALRDPKVIEQLRANEGDREAQKAIITEALLASDDVDPAAAIGLQCLALFDQFLVSIEPLEVGDEPFDRERHLDDIPTNWKIQLGRQLMQRINGYLTDEEVGNSSSPLSSEETETTSPATANAVPRNA